VGEKVVVSSKQRREDFFACRVGVLQASLLTSAYSTFLLLPLGAGSMRGVYVTVRVTTSLMCRTLRWLLPQLWPLAAADSARRRALSAASQSKGLRTLRALKGDMTGVSPASPTAGDGGILSDGNVVGPVAGADMGYDWKGEGGMLWLIWPPMAAVCGPLGDLWT
jgi:hypothetical protein